MSVRDMKRQTMRILKVNESKPAAIAVPVIQFGYRWVLIPKGIS